MKSTPIFFVLLLIFNYSVAQIEYGIQGGLNFDSAGEILLLKDQIQQQGDLKSKSGYHFGLYAEVDFLVFYLRHELQYTKVTSQFEGNTIDNTRLELPLSFGLKVFGPLSLFLGPTAFFTLSNEGNGLNLQEVKDKTSLGMHIGTILKLGPIGFDIRYEKGFSAIESSLLSNIGAPTVGQIDTRPNQITIGLSLKLN